jgi:hypothetical protein
MYVGHFAIGLAIKGVKPKVPSLPIILGVGFMDFVDGLLIMLGADHVTPDLRSGPYLFFDLTFVDWDHSVLMAVVLSLFWAALFMREASTALVAGLAVLSHLLADLPVHNHDLALFPYSGTHLGMGLWGSLGTWSWILEGLLSAVLVAWAGWLSYRRQVSLLWPALLLCVLFVALSPWFSPMRWAASQPEPLAHLAHGAIVSLGFLLPGLLLTWLVNRAERQGAAVRLASP